MPDTFNVADWRGHDVLSADGEKLGKFEELYYDSETDDAAFLCVRAGRLSQKQVLVPASDLRVTPQNVTVPWAKDVLDKAPTTKPDEELTAVDEESVFQHFGLDYTPASSGTRRLIRR